jgi:hypothetical protein
MTSLITSGLHSKIDPRPILGLNTTGAYTGFFSIFHIILGALDLYEEGDFSAIEINLNNAQYVDSHKWSN